MQYRALTISRQYGSGGAAIASLISEELGWRLIDNELITAISKVTEIRPSVVRSYDECVDSWMHRVNREALRSMGAAAGIVCEDKDFFDADCMLSFTKGVIEQAYCEGNCVIVGRGAQCILQGRPDVFRTFVYAPVQNRLQRVRIRTGSDITVDELSGVDNQRARYLRKYYGRNWYDVQLYDLMISSAPGDRLTASVILNLMEAKGDIGIGAQQMTRGAGEPTRTAANLHLASNAQDRTA